MHSNNNNDDDEDDEYELNDEQLTEQAPVQFTRSQLRSQRHAARLHSDYVRTRFLRAYWVFGAFGSVVVFGILGYSYYVFVFVSTAAKWHAVGAWLAVPILIVWNFLFVMSVLSYASCVLRDPGLVPLDSNSDAHGLLPHSDSNSDAHGLLPHSDDSTARRGWSRCRRCNVVRPPRAHHCSVCDRCVLKMDHHCPWVNNCVGENNYKSFLLFVSYTALLSLFGIVCMLSDLVTMHWSKMDINDMMLLADFIVGCIFALMLTGFAVVHIGFVLNDTTTLDSYETRRPADPFLDEEGAPLKKTPRENFEAVFGPSTLLWFFPVQNHVSTFPQ